MPQLAQSSASGALSYIAAGEWGELLWRLAARLGVQASPQPFLRPRGPSIGDGAPHLVALTHSLDIEGAPLSLLGVLRGLVQRGMRVTLLAPGEGALAGRAREAGVHLEHVVPPQYGARGAKSYEAALEAFAGRLRMLRPSVVIANTLASFHGVDAARLIGVASILVVREGEPPAEFFRAYPRAIQARALGAMTYPDRIVFVSQASCDAWPDKAAPVIVIRNAPDSAAFAALASRWTRQGARAALSLAPDDFVFLSVGTICRRKGQMDLARAASAIAPARLLCVGPVGADGAPIAEALRRAGGMLAGSTEDVALYYAAADAFVLTSRVENYPRVIQEAQAFGLPLIVTPVNGVPEQVGEGEAMFYQPGDVDALAVACRRMAVDEALRSRLRAASTRRAAQFETHESMIEAYSGLVRTMNERG